MAKRSRCLRKVARIIDVGGASSRPRGSVYGRGALPVPPAEELRRVEPVVRQIVQELPEAIVSVDTCTAAVMDAALDAGAHMINDITGLRFGPEAAERVSKYGAALVVMHSVGQPGDMPHERAHASVETEVMEVLAESVAKAHSHGVHDIVVDPGFGFGKTPLENLRLMRRLSVLHVLNCPVLVGISRKSTVGYVLADGGGLGPTSERLYGSLGMTAAAVHRGAHIIRTHDVRPTIEMLKGFREVMTA